MKQLVILGTGWASYSVFRNVNRNFFKIIVVSPRNHFLFTPLLTSTTVGTLEFRSIIEPVRNTGFRDPHDFHIAEAISCDFEKRIVKCQNVLDKTITSEISYDKLVVGVGALPNSFNVPGVHEHAFFLKEIVDARKIRERILQNFELGLAPGVSEPEIKRLLHTVIVGGGPTGVEFGAELYDFIRQDVSRLYNIEKANVKVTLVESQKILGAFDEKLQSYAEKKFRERSNFNLIKNIVTEVLPNGVKLKDGSFLPCGLVVWSTGLAPREFTKNLDVTKTKQGQILTDNYLRIISDRDLNSYAIGDCSNIQDYPLPCTAQVAEREGRYLAKSLNEMAKNGNVSKPFTFKSMGMLAYIGDYKALSDLPEFKLKGITSWLLWRSAYLTRLGSWRLRLQVPLDWLKTLIFGRDTSRF
uniref:FAD/NAD(P)-binding domain-containing protein n=1 Tax=Panagrolaimus sp. ES5 TaxID=591445 RepID=A0AC34F3K7_9BILA